MNFLCDYSGYGGGVVAGGGVGGGMEVGFGLGLAGADFSFEKVTGLLWQRVFPELSIAFTSQE